MKSPVTETYDEYSSYVHTFTNILNALNMREKKIPRDLRIRNSYEKIIR